ncbi:MAG: LysR family transcriptional regulator [Lachnospiraceae bacterium]|nr:LysR family transcriptional regulator [Lachnospiraceae bacterium]
MIDSRLITFLKLCELMNYRKTAEELSLTQPAVSSQIKMLEQDYGSKLFLYDKRTLSMTKEAYILREYANNLVYQDKKIREKLKADEGFDICMGATKTIGEFVIASQVASFLSDDLNNLKVEIDNTERLLSFVESGELDFAIVEGVFDKAKFLHSLYRREPFLGVCNKHHRFAGKSVSINEIFEESLLIREEGSGTRDIFENILSEHNHGITEFKKVITINNFRLMMDVLGKINGITFAYKAVANSYEDLATFKIRGLDLEREFNYVYLDNKFSKEAVNFFKTFSIMNRNS